VSVYRDEENFASPPQKKPYLLSYIITAADESWVIGGTGDGSVGIPFNADDNKLHFFNKKESA